MSNDSSLDVTTLSLTGLKDRFISAHETMIDRSFAFILGAGASRTSNIKTASEMVDDWLPVLHRESMDYGTIPFKDWINTENLGIPDFDPQNQAAAYSDLYNRMYSSDPNRGYAYLEDQMKDSEPSFGYSVLARIMDTTRHKVVITTNFDNLVADALSIYGDTYPLVCGHESLAGFIRSRTRRPLIVKVHNDLLLAPKSDPKEIQTDLSESLQTALIKLFKDFTPIVFGYGGNDGSLMKLLNELPETSLPGGVYWCYWEEGPEPSTEIKEFVARQKGSLVPIPGFDETMMFIGDALQFPIPEQTLLDRAKKRAKRIVDQGQELQKTIDSINLSVQADGTATKTSPDTAELTQAINNTMTRTTGARTWWNWQSEINAEKNEEKRDHMYMAAIKNLPQSAELHGNYALFLKTIRSEYDAAEEQHKIAIEIDPENTNLLGNYAIFLTDIRSKYDAAEEYYKKAIEIDPKNADILGNYANFLTDICSEYDAAEKYYKKAIEIDPKNAGILGNYAVFLKNTRSEYDAAEEYYKKAIEIDPKKPKVLGNYANFLTNIRSKYDAAEEYYKKAIEIDPENAGILGNYALFLKNIRSEYDAAEEYYKKAIEINPKNAGILEGYANFLTDIRSEHDAAEKLYKKVIELDPKNANHFGNYARLCLSLNQLDEGRHLIQQSFLHITDQTVPALTLELWMYQYCCGEESEQPPALIQLKRLVLENLRTGTWDYSGVIATAQSLHHPEADWLPVLAAVLANKEQVTSLDEWAAWQHIA